MGNLRDLKERQKFLQDQVNMNLLKKKDATHKAETRWVAEDNFIRSLVDWVENKEELEYRRLRNQFGR